LTSVVPKETWKREKREEKRERSRRIPPVQRNKSDSKREK